MDENIEKVASGGDIIIWVISFGFLLIVVGYLAYTNKDIER